MKGNTAVIGVFANRESAQATVRDLRNAGFEESEIGVLGRHGEEPSLDRATNSKIAEGSVIGAATGAGAGALWALGIATIGLPAIGPAVAGGVFMALLASAGGGAAVGTLVGALVGLGVPEEEANWYQSELEAGRYLVTVRSDAFRRGEIDAIFSRHGGYDRSTTPLTPARSRV
jgi:hypothetical protein